MSATLFASAATFRIDLIFNDLLSGYPKINVTSDVEEAGKVVTAIVSWQT